MKTLLLGIAAARMLPPAEDSRPYFNRLLKAPTLYAQIKYSIGQIMFKAEAILSKTFVNGERRWGVAFARRDWKGLVMWKTHRIETPAGHFLADPFVVSKHGKDYCFVEDYRYSVSRGCISVYELVGETALFIGEALTEPYHLSFPFIFEFNNRMYMIPESCEKRQIRLYEAVSFPCEWRIKKIIMDGVSAADTMIFYHKDYWWLFTNIDPLGGDEHCSQLAIYYASDPVNGDWLPHKRNPVILDPLRARNGGILFDGSSIYRVAQRYGFNQYGAGCAINKIAVLDPENYEEEVYCAIEPNFFDGLIGVHHMHSNGAVTVFDYL
jgi:hypothetical protein